MFQEIEIETGNLIFQWRASDNVPLTDSYKDRGGDGKTKETSYDFFHLNSIEKDSNGNYLISSRHMHTIYYLNRTGNIIWTLGGRHSDFADLSDGYASDFRWQHHARWHENHTMSLFDNNGNNVFHSRSEHSRGMTISLDLKKMTVELQNTYVHPDKILAISQGSMHVIPQNGHVLVGWGNTPAYTEFTADGEVLCNMYFGALIFSEILDLGWVKSYRAFKSPWIGKPKAPPNIAAKGGEVHVSWNGATEVAGWRLQSAEAPDAADMDFFVIEELPKSGFETTFLYDGIEDHFVRAIALDAAGNVLGMTNVIDTFSPPAVSLYYHSSKSIESLKLMAALTDTHMVHISLPSQHFPCWSPSLDIPQDPLGPSLEALDGHQATKGTGPCSRIRVIGITTRHRPRRPRREFETGGTDESYLVAIHASSTLPKTLVFGEDVVDNIYDFGFCCLLLLFRILCPLVHFSELCILVSASLKSQLLGDFDIFPCTSISSLNIQAPNAPPSFTCQKSS